MNSFVFPDSDSDGEPEAVNIATATVARRKIAESKPIVRKDNDETFRVQTKKEVEYEFTLKKTNDNFPPLQCDTKPIKQNTNIGIWSKKSGAHEYADTGVKAVIQMPPLHKKPVKVATEQFYDDESDVEGEDDEFYEQNAELDYFRERGENW